MNPTQLITGRRSIRKYKDDLVTREDIQAIMEETRFTQSWKNLQIARFTVVQDPDRIARIASEGVNDFIYNAKTITKAKNLMILSFVHGVSGKIDESGYATSKGDSWEVFDAGIACQTFALAAYGHGIGTCVMGIIDDAKIAEIIDLPKEETVAALIVFGYPDEEGRPTGRLSSDEICRYL
ncbi:MAG: nitroreductase family protein [Eubacteriales bacterium]